MVRVVWGCDILGMLVANHTLYCRFFSFSMMSKSSGSTSDKEEFNTLGHCVIDYINHGDNRSLVFAKGPQPGANRVGRPGKKQSVCKYLFVLLPS